MEVFVFDIDKMTILEFLLTFFTIIILMQFIFFMFLKNKKDVLLILLLFVTIFIRLIISVLNAKFGPFPGADVDAVDFIIYASSEISLFNIGTEVYLGILGILFENTEKSVLNASNLSIIAVLPYLAIVISVLKKHKTNIKIKLLYALILMYLPSNLLFHSVSLREAYMISGMAIIMFYGCKLIDERVQFKNLLILSLGFFLLAWFHKGTLLISILCSIYLSFFMDKYIRITLMFFISTFLIFFISTSNGFSGRGLEVIFAIADGSIIEYTQNYRSSSESLSATTTYTTYDSNDNIFLLAIKSIFHYVFLPFPTSIMSVTGLYLSFERFISYIIIFYIYRNFNVANENEKKKLIFIIGLFIINTVIWSMGTSNYGTGLRHHTTHDFLIIIASYILISIKTDKNNNEKNINN